MQWLTVLWPGQRFMLVSIISFSLQTSRTPLHCAASCNSVQLCKMLVESGAAIFATTISDVETAADKCEEMEEGYTQCSQFLYGGWNEEMDGMDGCMNGSEWIDA